jgi:ribosome-binding protein aMBF1 (putative translation factor)
MSVAVKTHHIKRTRTTLKYHYAFKKTTPKKVLSEISLRYSKYLEQDQDDHLIDIATTDWFKNMENKMKPMDHLKNLREAHGLTQKRLGEMIETNAAHISDYETGQRSMSKAIAKQLGKIFKTSPAIFI